MNFENWCKGEVSKNAKKVNFLRQKSSESFSIYFSFKEN